MIHFWSKGEVVDKDKRRIVDIFGKLFIEEISLFDFKVRMLFAVPVHPKAELVCHFLRLSTD